MQKERKDFQNTMIINPIQLLGLICCICSLTFASAQQLPFNRGMNMGDWFEEKSAADIHFAKYSKKDMELITRMGCDVIRIPIYLQFMHQGGPDYTLDPRLLKYLDQVVDWAEELQVHLILDNHTFDPSTSGDASVGPLLQKLWLQMAQHFKDRSLLIHYELLNDPHNISDDDWHALQLDLIDVIRRIDRKHSIIIGGNHWSSYQKLINMPDYEDANLIYSFRFFDPFLFTHQGMKWVNPSLSGVFNMPFPFDSAAMTPLPEDLKESWVEEFYKDYPAQATTGSVLGALEEVARFKNRKRIPVFCSEFGVFQHNVKPEDRLFWVRLVRTFLEENDISWAYWEYRKGFGLFEPLTANLYRQELNLPLLDALGLSLPRQDRPEVVQDTAGLIIYDDFLQNNILSYADDGKLNFRSTDQPNNGRYCIHWTGGDQNRKIVFDFRPKRNLKGLMLDNFALDLVMRSVGSGHSYDILFADTQTGHSADRPWSVKFTIDETVIPADGRWYQLHIPLQQFKDSGAWQDNAWYEGPGNFDWEETDRLEIINTNERMSTTHLWLDHIQLTNSDTSRIKEHRVIATPGELAAFHQFDVFPNPASQFLMINGPHQAGYRCSVINALGREVAVVNFFSNTRLDISSWPPGLYVLQFREKELLLSTRKILKM